MNRPSCFLVVALFLLAGCGETITQYRADSSGKLRKIATESIPHRNEVVLKINGASFAYNFRAIGGNVGVRGPLVTELGPGEHRSPFFKLRDGHITETSKTSFGGNIYSLKNRNLKTETLVSDARAGGEMRNMFRPAGKPYNTEYRNVSGRQWLVTTKFEDSSKTLVDNQTWWSVTDDFLITFNINFIGAPPEAAWRQQRLQMLEKLVSDFRYVPARFEKRDAIVSTADLTHPTSAISPGIIRFGARYFSARIGLCTRVRRQTSRCLPSSRC